MSITTYRDEANRLFVHYDNDMPQPTQFVIWLEGKCTTIVGRPGEHPSAVWQRTLNCVRLIRGGFVRVERIAPKHRHPSLHLGNPYREGNVYAGIEPTVQQVQAHLKQWMIWSLYKRANSPYSSAMQKVNSLWAIAEISELVKPDQKFLPPFHC